MIYLTAAVINSRWTFKAPNAPHQQVRHMAAPTGNAKLLFELASGKPSKHGSMKPAKYRSARKCLRAPRYTTCAPRGSGGGHAPLPNSDVRRWSRPLRRLGLANLAHTREVAHLGRLLRSHRKQLCSLPLASLVEPTSAVHDQQFSQSW